MDEQQLRTGGSAEKWQADFRGSASSTIRCGSKTEIFTPRLAFLRASIWLWLGGKRIAAPVWRMRPLRELVLFLRRRGGQPQLSVSLASQASEMMSIRELQIWIVEHLQTKLLVDNLA